jgi:Golgi apparatus protein 1
MLIGFFSIQRQMGVGSEWSQDSQSGRQTELRYSYRFVCQENYYGESCSKKCMSRDDRFGHYTCTRDGQLSCMAGWKGKYCEERKHTSWLVDWLTGPHSVLRLSWLLFRFEA